VRRLSNALLLATVAFAAGTLPAEELLVNGGFDGGTTGWRATTPPACAAMTWRSEGQVEVSGSCSPAARNAGWSQEVTVSGIGHLLLEVRASTEQLSGRADAVLTFTGAGGEVLWSTGSHVLTSSAGWTDLRWAVPVPVGAVKATLFVGAEILESGSVRIDRVSLQTAQEGGYRTIRVDCGGDAGTIRNLLATNRSPYQEDADYGAQAAAAGIRWVRLHDEYRGCDMSEIFPDPTADPDDPASYRFDGLDRVVGRLHDEGFEVLFRLGESWKGPPSARMSADRWARVAANVVRHLDMGWAGGHRWGIRYWEIWNEPNGGHFWDGSREDFFQLYVAAAKAIGSLDPSFKVGGPALAGFSSVSWVEAFLDAVQAAGAPLDFFTWHTYHMGNPIHLADAQRTVRRLLDDHGFTATEVFPDEWNLSPGSSCSATNCGAYTVTAYSAAHAAAALTYMQDTTAPFVFRYRTDAYPLFGLFGDGVTVPAYAPSGLAYRLMAAFDETPIRLPAEGGDETGYAVLAGRGAGEGAVIHVLVADPGSGAAGYDLVLDHAPAAFRWEVREIADPIPWTGPGDTAPLVASGDEGDLEGGRLRISMSSPAVQLVTIVPVDRRRPPARPRARAVPAHPAGSTP